MANKGNGSDKRIRILEALSLCLQEKPFSRTSIKEIAATAGVNHGLLHYYFESKEDILSHYIDYVIFHYQSIFEEWLAGMEKADIDKRELVESFFDYMNDRITLNRQLSTVFIEIWEIGIYNPAIRKKLQAAYLQWIQVLTGILARIMDDRDAAERAGTMIVAFQEGMSLLSVLFDNEAFDLQGILVDFRRRMIDSL
jgi:AcrR family transcriptional regulator